MTEYEDLDQGSESPYSLLEVSQNVEEEKKRRTITRSTSLAWIAFCTVFVVIGTLFCYWSHAELAQASARLEKSTAALDEQVAAEKARQEELAEAKRRADAEKAKQDSEREMMADIGMESAGNGIYYRWATADEVSCGMWTCMGVYVMTGSESCPTSVYVEANVVSNGVAVSLANGTLGGLASYSSGFVILEDYSGMGDSFQLSQISCY